MFCANCGLEITKQDRFCPHCGKDNRYYRPDEPKAEADVVFYDEHFLAQVGSMFLMTSDRDGKSGKDLKAYYYPMLNQILKEKKSYRFACCLHDDYYIYC